MTQPKIKMYVDNNTRKLAFYDNDTSSSNEKVGLSSDSGSDLTLYKRTGTTDEPVFKYTAYDNKFTFQAGVTFDQDVEFKKSTMSTTVNEAVQISDNILMGIQHEFEIKNGQYTDDSVIITYTPILTVLQSNVNVNSDGSSITLTIDNTGLSVGDFLTLDNGIHKQIVEIESINVSDANNVSVVTTKQSINSQQDGSNTVSKMKIPKTTDFFLFRNIDNNFQVSISGPNPIDLDGLFNDGANTVNVLESKITFSKLNNENITGLVGSDFTNLTGTLSVVGATGTANDGIFLFAHKDGSTTDPLLKANISLNANADLLIQAPSTGSVKLDAEYVNTTGNIEADGNIKANGYIESVGNITATGNLLVSNIYGDAITATGDISGDAITATGAISGPTLKTTSTIESGGDITVKVGNDIKIRLDSSNGAISGASLNAGSGLIKTTGDLEVGAITGASLNAGSGLIKTTGDLEVGAITGTSLNASGGAITGVSLKTTTTIESAGNITVLDNNNDAKITLDTAGNINASGSVTHTSDIRLKKDITKLDNSLEKIMKLEGVSYKWKDNDTNTRSQIGLIAQNVQEFFPELVNTNAATGFLSVNYSQLISPLIEAVKSQQEQIEILKQKIADLN